MLMPSLVVQAHPCAFFSGERNRSRRLTQPSCRFFFRFRDHVGLLQISVVPWHMYSIPRIIMASVSLSRSDLARLMARNWRAARWSSVSMMPKPPFALGSLAVDHAGAGLKGRTKARVILSRCCNQALGMGVTLRTCHTFARMIELQSRLVPLIVSRLELMIRHCNSNFEVRPFQ
ncbi:hypothetical protein BC940DRAFT_296787 [Gongronella butleri]|nr:hypothetical protein BC940DRAFT_296787 [Gongronella butleri]